MKFVRLVSVLFALAVTAAANSYTAGAERTALGQYRWKGGPIKIYVSSSLLRGNANIKSGTDVLAALRGAIAAWSEAADVTLEIQMTDKQGVSPAGAAGDGVSLLTIAATPENVLFFTRGSQDLAAKTRIFFNRKGTITEGDIVLNPFQQFSTDGSYATFDLQSVFTHEIGHLLGLHHSDVRGSVMLESIPKNGASFEFAMRELSDADIAAVRDVYGTVDLMDDCCGVISGRLSAATGRLGKDIRVWAEDSSNGRVVGQAEAGADGTFRMGGISAGEYKIFARSASGASEEIATVELEPTGEKTINRSVALYDAKVALDLVGLNGRLAEPAIIVSKGNKHTLYVSGKDLDAQSVKLSVNSRFLHIDASSILQKEAADDAGVLSFDLIVDPETPRGIYSLFASAGGSTRSVLIGALRVQ